MSVRALMSAAVLVGLAAGPARAGVIYATGFEDPPFAAGSVLTGQDGWVSPDFTSPDAATISTAAPSTGLQGVRVLGADMVPNEFLRANGYDAVGSYRPSASVNFDAVGAGLPVVRLQADVRLDGPLLDQTDPRPTGDFVSANVNLVLGDGQFVSLTVSSDGHIYGYGVDPSEAYLFGTAVSLGTYYNLGLEANFVNQTFGYYLDGALLGTTPFAGPSDGVVRRGSLVVAVFLPEDAPPGITRDQYTAYFDNYSLTAQAVPEPASVGLLAAGGLGLLGYARRRAQATA
ncbi:MAG: PEP-CTERM sorting domain-containing protein [Gemmataceae bacterium]|nr:PEP-CTERM sorting domain-containing protein [Gemmataceae bacterium]